MAIADEMKVALRTAYYAWKMGADIDELANNLGVPVGVLAQMFVLREYRDLLES